MAQDPGHFPPPPDDPRFPRTPDFSVGRPTVQRDPPHGPGSIRLFRVFGITVFLHWTWFLVAVYQIQQRRGLYSSVIWNVAEYITLFLIVLLHEFGHALACRSVGGKAEKITLWPLGGVAFVSPPPRPGAMLWSIAAGPLVNVILVPITFGISYLCRGMGHDLALLTWEIFAINLIVLIFNMLPIYPLDGGQILQSLLWFGIGRARSLMAAAWVGIIGASALGVLAFTRGDTWLVVMAVFAATMAFRGVKNAKDLLALERAPRHRDAECPHCKMHPIIGPFWRCPCGNELDIFAQGPLCPQCGSTFHQTRCLDCGETSPISAWLLPTHPAPPVAPVRVPSSLIGQGWINRTELP